MEIIHPATAGDAAGALRASAEANRKIRTGGSFSKDGMGGPLVAADVCITSAALNRVLQYEPKDLTISVEAGMPWRELMAVLAQHGQTVPLDPPFFERATVGGAIAANTSGPRRRLYGSARDLVIGMRFATLEGKLVNSGGMVVKNVAGLDMAKLMIGSFGTLAFITSVNFKLTPIPEATRTFVFCFDALDEAIAMRDRILQSPLQPSAIDLLNPAASDRVGMRGYCLAIQAAGVEAVLDRYGRELEGASALSREEESRLWTAIREFVPNFLAQYPAGAVLRCSTTLAGVRDVIGSRTEPCLARAGTGVTWVCLENAGDARPSKTCVIEFASEQVRSQRELWVKPGTSFDVMKRIKAMFDPAGLLNPGRLYGHI